MHASYGDSDSDAEVARSPKKSERARRTSEEWSASKMAELMHSIDSMSKFSSGSAEYPHNDRVGFATTTWRLDMGFAPSDAFYQLVQAEDDSLSVIQRTALKLYERQQERERLRHENEKQQRQEPATFDSPYESEESDNGDDSPARQFARLDEIMQEVDRERSLNRAALDNGESEDGELADNDDVDSGEASSDRVERLYHASGEVTASSEFWNRLISEPVVQEGEDDDEEEQGARQRHLAGRTSHHVEIDTSELEAQREQRLQRAEREAEDDDDLDALGDPDKTAGRRRRRVNSPHTLAKRLLAEVEYHEAINDAHLKLTVMEQVQLLEQAQAETINIATAFKEEMEQNAVNHQLALDHTALAKRFDDDLFDVVQQLHDIEEIEEQEHAAREIASEVQLKQARMRECSVQTEDPRVADVGTSAPLHVDAGTSPTLPSMSTAVQYELSDFVAPGASPGSKLQISIKGEEGRPDEGEDTANSPKVDDSEAIDYGDDGFEQESGLYSRTYGAQDGSGGEDEEIHSESGSAKGGIREASEAESVIESATSLGKSNAIESKEESGEIEEEDDPVSDAAESLLARSEDEDHVESATAEYEDDFNASSPTEKADRGLAGSEVDDDFDVESDYDEGGGDKNGTSIEDVDVEDDDEAHGDVEEDHHVATDSVKDATIEDDFEDEFAQSVDDEEEEGKEELPDDDAEVDGGSEGQPEHSAKVTHKAITDKAVPQSTAANGINTIYATSAAVEANMRLHDALTSGFGYPQQFMAPSVSLYSQTAVDAAQSEHVVQAYMVELERRKQSEASMLCLRLQAAETHFAHQTRRIDAAIADINVDGTAKAELMARKQRLTIAFMGEQANIESLKAAATARYFQDMLAFQSLYASDSPNVPVANGVGLKLHHTWAATAEIPVPTVTPRAESLHAAKSSIGAESECYEDEFASATYDDAKNSRSSIVESGEKSVIDEEEDAYESEKQPSDGSIASEVEQVSQEQLGRDADEPQSDVDVESDVEQGTDEKSVEEEDENPKEEEEVQSDEYAQSEFEDETQDTPEEQAIVEETAMRDEIDEDEHEVESASSGAVSEINGPDGDFETSEIQEEGDGEVNSDSVKSDDIEDGGYDDDFASISESMHRQDVANASVEDAPVDESGEEDVNEEGELTPSVATSEHEHEIASNDSEDEVKAAPGAFARESNASASAAAYSEDDFEESERAEDSPTVTRRTTLDVAESVAHSTSNDSSTTKLLVAEVDTIQKLVTGGGDADVQSDKLTRKKSKVIELLEAKERLLRQQTRAFRLEEEKRMVNEAAHLALGLDISQELREAKASITSELQSEFDALRMSFPRLKRVEKPSIGEERAATVAADKPAPQITPAVVQSAAIEAVTERCEGADDGDYDAQSFEVVSESETNKSVREEDDDDELPDDAPIANTASDRVQASVASAAEEEIPEGDDDAAANSVQSEVEEEQEEQFEVDDVGDAAAQSDGRVDSEDEGYENDYENESFADAQSAASVVDEDDAVEDSLRSEHVVDEAEVSDAAARPASAIQSGAASEYTEDDFEQASESEAAPNAHSKEDEEEEEERDVPVNSAAAATPQDQEMADADDSQSSGSEHELSAALATVASQLDEYGPEQVVMQHGNGLDAINKPSEHTLDRADESTRELATSVLTPALESRHEGQSLSTSSEEETLTKSIEERMARLEKLKARILERQNDIRQVHKQLRIEKRKEALTTEEKALWTEVEGLEHELQCDVASLELMRQRNRLEFNQLEARQQLASMNPLGYERDLLIGFDHIEVVEPCAAMTNLRRDVDVQTPSGVEVECQTVAAPTFKEKELTSTYSGDLLACYDYVEHAQEVLPRAVVATGRNEENADAELTSDFSIAKHGSPECDINAIDRPSPPCGTERAAEVHGVSEEDEHSVDLLRDYAYIEVVEPLCDSEINLLAEFDYSEDVEPLVEASGLVSSAGAVADHHSVEESGDSGSEWLAEQATDLEAPASDGSTQVESEESSAADDEATVEPKALPDEPSAREMQPGSDDEVSEDASFGDDASGDEAPAPILSTPQDLEVGDGNRDQEQVLDEDPEGSERAGVGHIDDGGKEIQAVNDEETSAATDDKMVNIISSLILADLLQDTGSGT